MAELVADPSGDEGQSYVLGDVESHRKDPGKGPHQQTAQDDGDEYGQNKPVPFPARLAGGSSASRVARVGTSGRWTTRLRPRAGYTLVLVAVDWRRAAPERLANKALALGEPVGAISHQHQQYRYIVLQLARRPGPRTRVQVSLYGVP